MGEEHLAKLVAEVTLTDTAAPMNRAHTSKRDHLQLVLLTYKVRHCAHRSSRCQPTASSRLSLAVQFRTHGSAGRETQARRDRFTLRCSADI